MIYYYYYYYLANINSLMLIAEKKTLEPKALYNLPVFFSANMTGLKFEPRFFLSTSPCSIQTWQHAL